MYTFRRSSIRLRFKKMKTTFLVAISSATMIVGTVFTAAAQTEGGGGGRASISFSTTDTTVKRRSRPAAKRTAPKKIAPQKTAAEYEAEGNRLYDQKDYDSALVAYQNAARLKPSFQSLYR